MDKEKDFCYVVEMHEGFEWVPKARYNFEDTEIFVMVAKNPFYRILKDGKDITSNYKNESDMQKSKKNKNEFDSKDIPNNSSEITDNADKPLKPAEYKAMSSEDKQKLKSEIKRMLDSKTKRNDIFHTLNISEATYDTIRMEMKNSINSSETESKSTKIARKGSLLGR